MNVYRPTVRYAPVFRDYVESIFRATTLDRNQIIRAALFAAAHSEKFYSILKQYQKKDVPLPCPSWKMTDHELWLEQCPENRRGGEDVNANTTRRGETSVASEHVAGTQLQQHALATNRRVEPPARREGEISSERQRPIQFRETGGIVIRLG